MFRKGNKPALRIVWVPPPTPLPQSIEDRRIYIFEGNFGANVAMIQAHPVIFRLSIPIMSPVFADLLPFT